MPEWIIKWLASASWWEVFGVFLIENLAILALVMLVGRLAIARYTSRRVSAPPEALSMTEVIVTLVNVFLNTATTLAGLWLWRNGTVQFTNYGGFYAVLYALLDIILLLFVMDLLMYVLHRVAHFPIFYTLLHAFHHKYDRVRPLTLFALNPFENIAFGVLWLLVITVYHASWLGMSTYLILNVFFGAVGHLGVEPFPRGWVKNPVLGNFAGGSFHAQHHQDSYHNFGFYTLLWDRLFGTLRPDYEQNYGQLPNWLEK